MLKSMQAHRNPGEETEYTSSNTVMVGMFIEAVTDKPLARAISDLLWQPMGAEADGLLTINKFGEAYASGGLSARLSDVARLGLMFFDNDQG
jgi:CubicO group peptidase (beta-lactamase class C family)